MKSEPGEARGLLVFLLLVLSRLASEATPLTLLGWGSNSHGQLNFPTNLNDVRAIAGGAQHSMALNADQSVTAWGDNWLGQINVPTNLPAVAGIGAGDWHSFAILPDGTVRAWGWNDDGQCNVPAGLSNVITVTGGLQHSAALKADGRVVAWGLNNYGQASAPAGLSNVVGIALGKAHSVALKRDGTVVGWGGNYSGQLNLPVTTNVAMVSAASDNTLILTRDGLVYACGFAQYGLNTVPAGISNVVAISSGGAQQSVLFNDGLVTNWGNIPGPPPDASNIVTISAAALHTLALQGDGSPGIVLQPVGDAVVAGTVTSFRVHAAGAQPLALQWRVNGSEISGATNADIHFTPAQPMDRGNYDVVVTNAVGSITSLGAVLVVNEVASVTNQPQSLAVRFSEDVTFIVGAHGTFPLTYQWSFNGSNLLDATNSSLTLSNVLADRSGDYRVVIANAFGMATSAVATLSVTTSPPVITVPLGSVSATKGAEIVFAPAVLGVPPPLFQWYLDGAPIDGGTNNTFVFTNAQVANAGGYSFVASNEFGSVTSIVATLTITAPPGFLWARDGGGTNADEGRSVAVDADGNIFVAGYFTDAATIGGSNLVSAGSTDFFIARFDPAGNLVWIRQGGGSSDDRAQGIAVEATCNVLVAGYLTGNTTLGGFNLTGAGGSDVFLARYDPDGNLLWATNAGGVGTDQALGVAVDKATNVYLTGLFSGSATFGTNNLVVTGGTDIFVARYDAGGNCLWVRKAGGLSSDQGRAVACDPAGNFFVTGDFFSHTATFGSFTLNNVNSPGGAFTDIFVAKYDASGNVLWAARGGGSSSDFGRAIAVDAAGNVIASGDFIGTASFGSLTVNAAGASDVYLAKYDPHGSHQWLKSAGGTSGELNGGLTVDAGGNVFTCGRFGGTASFGGTNLVANGLDVFIAMYAPGGDALWAIKAGGSGTDQGQAVAADTFGNVYLIGLFNGSATFGHMTLTAGGNSDLFFAKVAAFDPGLPPIITADLPNTTAVAGDNLILAPGFAGSGPMSFQWWFNGSGLGGATNSTLLLSNVTAAQAGDYTLVLSNVNGAVTSAVSTVSVSVEPDFVWARRGGGTTNDVALATVTDSTGNVYAAGYFTGAADFSGNNLLSSGGEDAFVAKYTAAGTLLWVKQFGGTGDDRATALARVATGGVALGGQYSGTVQFNGTTLTNAGSTDVFLARLDANGNVSWAVSGGGANDDVALGVAVNSLVTGFYITGSFQANALFGNMALSGTGTSNRLFIAKFDSSGNFSWARTSTGSGSSQGRAITADPGNYVYVGGAYSGTQVFGATSLFSTGALSGFVAKYSSSVNSMSWVRNYGTAINSPSSDVRVNGLTLDTNNNLFVVGEFQGEVPFVGPANATSFNTNHPDGFLLRLDSNGNTQWMKQLSGDGPDTMNSVTADNLGNAYCTGFFAGRATLGGEKLTSAGGQEMFVALYDSLGTLVKARRAGGTGDDIGTSIATDGSGGVYVAGTHSAPAAFGSNALSTAGADDAFLTRLSFFSANGPPQITTQPRSQSVAVGSNSTLTVACLSSTPVTYQWSRFGTNIPGATSNSFTLVNAQYANVGDFTVRVQNSSPFPLNSTTSEVAVVNLELSPEFFWLRKAGGTGDDQALAVALDGTNAIYVAGLFTGTNPTFTNLASAGGMDMFLAKYDGQGNFLWAKRAGGTLADAAQAVRVDASGDVLVAGHYFSTTATFDGVTLTNRSDPAASFSDLFLAKYDSNGNLLWARRGGGLGNPATTSNRNDTGTALATDTEGNIYLTGSYHSTADFGGITLANLNETNFFVAKYNSVGEVVWARTTAGVNTSQGNGICVDAAANVYVTGFLLGSLNLSNGVLTNTSNAFINGTVFVAKYDTDGHLQWTKKGGTTGMGFGQNIAVDAAGNIFATSYRRDYGGGVMLTKYDGGGGVLWVRTNSISCCTSDYISVNGLAIDGFGNPMLAGGVTGSATFEGLSLNSGGFVVKYRARDGTPFYVQRLGTMGQSAALDAVGNAFLAGRFSGTSAFGATSNLVSSGGNDAFLIKLGIRPPVIAAPQTILYVLADSNVVLSVTATGTGPFAYQWQFNGTNLTGQTTSTLTLNNFQFANAGSYAVVVHNTTGSVSNGVALLTLIPTLNLEHTSDGIILSWLGSFILQSATNATGPFLDLPSGESPFTNLWNPDEPQKYLRLRSP